MNTKLIFAQVLLAFVSGQAIEDSTETSPVPDMMDQAMSVGLLEPTSPWEVAAAAKETSPEAPIAEATGAPLNLLMNGGAEGDMHGANPRNNMVYFGVGRHGVAFGDVQNGNCDHGHHPHHAPCEHHHEQAQPCHQENCGHENCAQPYVRVTPCVSVETVTRTHVQTCLKTSLEVLPYYTTRTFTDELRVTKTHVARPEITHTYLERQTVYEYPAATIKGDTVRCAPSVTCAPKKQHC